MKKIIIIGVLTILLLPIVSSFSLTPGIEKIYFEPGLKRTVSFTVINNDEYTKLFKLNPASKRGEISGIVNDMISIREPSVIIEKGKSHVFLVDITMPETFPYGIHEVFINIFGDEPDSDDMISVQTALAFKVIIYSLYPGKYIKAELLRPNSVEVGGTVNFRIKVENVGTENIENIRSKIDIYDEERYVESVYSDGIFLLSKGTADITAKLIAKDYSIGKYTAKASVEYDGLFMNVSPTRTFNIGELVINVINITSRKFENNKINKFDVIVESKWNHPVDVYADVIISDFSGSKKEKFKTQTITVDGWKQKRIPAYFDIKNIENGKYKMKVILHYVDKTSEKEFDIEIAEEEGEAEIVEEKPTTMSKQTMFIIGQSILIIVLLIVVLVIFLSKKRTKNKKEGKTWRLKEL